MAKNHRPAPRRAAATCRHSPVFDPSCRPAPPPGSTPYALLGTKILPDAVFQALAERMQKLERTRPDGFFSLPGRSRRQAAIPALFGVDWLHPEMGSAQVR